MYQGIYINVWIPWHEQQQKSFYWSYYCEISKRLYEVKVLRIPECKGNFMYKNIIRASMDDIKHEQWSKSDVCVIKYLARSTSDTFTFRLRIAHTWQVFYRELESTKFVFNKTVFFDMSQHVTGDINSFWYKYDS